MRKTKQVHAYRQQLYHSHYCKLGTHLVALESHIAVYVRPDHTGMYCIYSHTST